MTLFQWIERYFQRRQLRQLREWLAEDERASDLFDPERLAIYRVPLPLAPRVSLGYGEGATIILRRGFLDLLGLGPRAYIVDGAPGALFGKPNALAVFEGFGGPRLLLSHGPAQIGEDHFDYFTPSFLAELRVDGGTQAAGRRGPFIAAQTLNPLLGPFPPGDLPNPAPTAAPPTFPPPPTTPPGAGTPVYLFYGLCFQEPRPNKQALYVGPFKLRDAFLDTDPLWDHTKMVAQAFAARGYATATGLAGDHDPSATTDAPSFADMMAGLERHLNGVTAYCNSASDQLVIFIAVHGYGAPYNPTGEVALHYKPADAEEWINYHTLFRRLLAMPKVAGFPGKVYLLLYSCRSARVFEGGVLPGGLAGMHLITAAASSDVLIGAGGFSEWLRGALGDTGVLSWDDLIRHAKHAARADPFGPPRNGDAAGCRAQITLNGVAYQGDNIGSTWRYRLRVDGEVHAPDGSVKYRVPGVEADVPEHTAATGTQDAQNLPIYDALWAPCSAANTVHLNLFAEATQTEGVDDVGATSAALSITCDGSTTQHVVPVPVSETGGTARMVFSFTVATSCL